MLETWRALGVFYKSHHHTLQTPIKDHMTGYVSGSYIGGLWAPKGSINGSYIGGL